MNVMNIPQLVLTVMVPVPQWSASHFPHPWNCPCNDVCCMKLSGCPRLQFCSRGSETEGFGSQRLETGIPYSHTHTHKYSALADVRVHCVGEMHLIKNSAQKLFLPKLFPGLPEVKKVQGCHCFQNCKLLNQQSKDHGNPVDASVDFEHIAFISDLEWW